MNKISWSSFQWYAMCHGHMEVKTLPQLPYIILIMSTIYIFHPSINHSLIITTVRPICPTMKLHLFTLLMKVNI